MVEAIFSLVLSGSICSELVRAASGGAIKANSPASPTAGRIAARCCLTVGALEHAVWAGAAGGAHQSPCRAWSEQADAGLGGADPGLDAEAKAGRRVDALEHAQAGFGAVDLAHDGGAGMDKPRPEAPAARPLHGFE